MTCGKCSEPANAHAGNHSAHITESAALYDAVMLYARAVTKVRSDRRDYDYIDHTYISHNYIGHNYMGHNYITTKVLADGGDVRDGRAISAVIRNTSFVGVGGNIVELDNHGDRVMSYEVMNCVVGADDAVRP